MNRHKPPPPPDTPLDKQHTSINESRDIRPPVIPQHDDDDQTTQTTQKSDYDRLWELLYTSDCDNPIIQNLCQTGIERITAAKQQRQTCDLLMVQHLTLENMPPPQKKAQVEQMIELERPWDKPTFP